MSDKTLLCDPNLRKAIWVTGLNAEQYRELQEFAFKLGFEWENDGKRMFPKTQNNDGLVLSIYPNGRRLITYLKKKQVPRDSNTSIKYRNYKTLMRELNKNPLEFVTVEETGSLNSLLATFFETGQ